MKFKILIVDDEHGIVDMIQSYFQKQYDILTAYSGQEALQKISSCRIHCPRREALEKIAKSEKR